MDYRHLTRNELIDLIQGLEKENDQRREQAIYGSNQACNTAEDIKPDRIRDLRIASALILQTVEILKQSQTKSENLNLATIKLKESFMWIGTEINEQDGGK